MKKSSYELFFYGGVDVTRFELFERFISYNGDVYSKLLKDSNPFFPTVNPYEYEAMLKKSQLN